MVFQFKVRDHLRPEMETEYEVELCRACRYARVVGEFTADQVASFYTSGYHTHEETDAPAKPTLWLDRLLFHLAWRRDRGLDLAANEVPRTKEHPALCDVGCGAGLMMAKFKQAGYQVVGIEPDAAARAIASKNGEVLEGTAETSPVALGGRQFDVVLLSHVLEHCIDLVSALRSVKRLLAADGTAILEVPNNGSVAAEMLGPEWFFADIPRHLHFFTEGSLRAALGMAGLRVTRTLYTGYARQFSPEWLEGQQRIRASIGTEGWNRNAWELLARTAFSGAPGKYDSVRVHAVHEDAGA